LKPNREWHASISKAAIRCLPKQQAGCLFFIATFLAAIKTWRTAQQGPSTSVRVAQLLKKIHRLTFAQDDGIVFA